MINGHLRRMLYMYRYGSKSKRTLLICGHTKLLILTVTVVHRLRVQEFGRFRPQSCKADKLARKPPAISLDLARNLVSYQKNLFHDMHEIASCTTWTTRVKCSELGNNSNVSKKKESLIKLQRNQMRERRRTWLRRKWPQEKGYHVSKRRMYREDHDDCVFASVDDVRRLESQFHWESPSRLCPHDLSYSLRWSLVLLIFLTFASSCRHHHPTLFLTPFWLSCSFFLLITLHAMLLF